MKRSCDLWEHLQQLREDPVVLVDLCSLGHQEDPAERRNKLTHCRFVIQLCYLDCYVMGTGTMKYQDVILSKNMLNIIVAALPGRQHLALLDYPAKNKLFMSLASK